MLQSMYSQYTVRLFALPHIAYIVLVEKIRSLTVWRAAEMLRIRLVHDSMAVRLRRQRGD
jgi:hypothetical protein